jgi:hypothetical protein
LVRSRLEIERANRGQARLRREWNSSLAEKASLKSP